MPSLGQELLAHHAEIVDRWYARWCDSPHLEDQVSEPEIKDKLPLQLRVLGEQLQKLSQAEDPAMLWTQPERLDPELRVGEGVPIEDVVLGYKLLVDVLRHWIRERGLDVAFAEYTYLFDAVFELVGESVRRYATYRAEQVARERAEYLAGLTHQMRSPLSALALGIQLLEEVDPPVDPDLMERLHRNVHRLRVLVDGVMRLERFKPHELPVSPQPTHPARLIDEIMDDRAPEAARKGLRLVVHVDRTLRMTFDPELFRDALGNLVDNALRYTPSGFVQVEVEEEPDHILFKVRDSGPGVPPERYEELFSALYPDKPGSAGIGLTIVHRAVAAQGGEVGVESEPGRGSLFWFRLPRTVPATGDPES